MKQILITIAALVLVGCGNSQKSISSPESEAVESDNKDTSKQTASSSAPRATESDAENPSLALPPDKIHEHLLLKAVEEGNIKSVKENLAFGTDVNAKFDGDWTPLHIAAANNYLDIAKLIISKGGDVNKKDENKNTPLHIAAFSGKKEVAELLILKGADVNAKASFEASPLHISAAEGHKDITKLLISKSANINAKNESGWTVLHCAVVGGHKEITKQLIDKGADVNAKVTSVQNQGSTPLDAAIETDQPEIADLLRKHGGKTGEELKAEVK